MLLLVPTYAKVSGVNTKTYPPISEGVLFYGNFKTYGGTERDVNGVYSIMDTAHIECWYRPDITSECRIVRASDNAVFDIINEPEDINQRHQFLKFTVRRIKGGV
jgi:hypothetical protein